jgi:hypothetical protein
MPDVNEDPLDPVLLLVDILGTKSVWAQEGRDGATALFDQFADLIRREAESDSTGILSGAIEGDCAALIFDSAVNAVRFGTGLYCRTFFGPRSAAATANRIWLRGVIVRIEGAADVQWLRTQEPLSVQLPQLRRETYSGELLDALSMEKAGFKGMRLLIDPGLITTELRRKHRLLFGTRRFFPFKHLANSAYGPRLDDHLDVLWMSTADDDLWRKRRARMSARMRYSAKVVEEVLQAAATQVVFDECGAIIDSLAPVR